MRSILLTILTLLSFTSMAQNGALNKTWVTADHLLYAGTFDDTFFFETLAKKGIVINYDGGRSSAMANRFAGYYNLVKDTLQLRQQKGEFQDHSDFLLDTSKADILTLLPINTSAKQICEGILRGTDEKLVFRNIKRDRTDTVKFEKIIYKQVGGYHSAPAIVYEFGKDKKVRLYHEKDTRHNFIQTLPADVIAKLPPERRPVPEGYFTADIDPQLLKQLIEILKTAELDVLPSKGNRNIDIPDHTIEIYYNHKIKHIFAGWVPVSAEPLLRYLEALPAKLALKPTDKFDVVFAQKD